MNFEDIQRIVIVYGTKKSVESFAKRQCNGLKKSNNKLDMIEIKNNRHTYFDDIKKFLWKGD